MPLHRRTCDSDLSVRLILLSPKEQSEWIECAHKIAKIPDSFLMPFEGLKRITWVTYNSESMRIINTIQDGVGHDAHCRCGGMFHVELNLGLDGKKPRLLHSKP